MPYLFWSISIIGVAKAFASPKPIIEIPVARPFCSENQSIKVLTGVRYPIPRPIPMMQP